MQNILGPLYLKDLESEAAATRKCLERVPTEDYTWKPHEKSMELGYLAYLVAEIPRWIAFQVKEGEIDFATFTHEEVKSTEALLAYFDANMELARTALTNVTDQQLTSETFSLKNQGQLLMSSPKGESVSSSLRHLAHHRGQLTVYLRLKDIPVPSIYGPSADERSF